MGKHVRSRTSQEWKQYRTILKTKLRSLPHKTVTTKGARAETLSVSWTTSQDKPDLHRQVVKHYQQEWLKRKKVFRRLEYTKFNQAFVDRIGFYPRPSMDWRFFVLAQSWFEESRKYVDSLPAAVHRILVLYKQCTFYNVFQSYFRNVEPDTVSLRLMYDSCTKYPEFKDAQPERFISLVVQKLETVILEAPPIPMPLFVYKGIRYRKFDFEHDNFAYRFQGFCSVSLDPGTAERFSSRPCCFNKILLPTGTKCLFLSGSGMDPTYEFEIILPPASTFVQVANETSYKNDWVYLL